MQVEKATVNGADGNDLSQNAELNGQKFIMFIWLLLLWNVTESY